MKPSWMKNIKRKVQKESAVVWDGENTKELIDFLRQIDDVKSVRNGGRYIKVVIVDGQDFNLRKGDWIVFDPFFGPVPYSDHAFTELFTVVK